jgi:hypothetical protein
MNIDQWLEISVAHPQSMNQLLGEAVELATIQ